MWETNPTSKYRAELIGGLLASHILSRLESVIQQGATGVQIYCDNLGLVQHAPGRPFSKKQAQSDVLTVST